VGTALLAFAYGVRPAELAERCFMTKQAMNYLLRDLEDGPPSPARNDSRNFSAPCDGYPRSKCRRRAPPGKSAEQKTHKAAQA